MPDTPLRVLAGCAVLALVAACGGGGGSTASLPPPGQPVVVAIERAFPNLAFDKPVAMLQAPEDATRWFLVEQDGVVRVFQNDPAVAATGVFIDIRARVASPADGRGSETGLLGMAFHPQFQSNGRVFLSYTAIGVNGLESRVSEFRSTDGGFTLDPAPAAERVVLSMEQPQDNHNGGWIAFRAADPGPWLYIGVGDGGGGNDQGTGHNAAIGNAQDLTRLLGKILRIDVAPATGYGIPPGNPFGGNPPCGPALNAWNCPEIFAHGFRNPWRWSFDRATGDLWVGDVGQNAREEAGRVQAGENHGWVCREGSLDLRPAACNVTQGLVNPVVEYGRSAGIAITGGYVYRGAAMPALQGRYVFGDFGTGRIWHIAGGTMPTLDVTNASSSAPVIDTPLSISSFAEGNDGELYVIDYGGTLHRLRAQ